MTAAEAPKTPAVASAAAETVAVDHVAVASAAAEMATPFSPRLRDSVDHVAAASAAAEMVTPFALETSVTASDVQTVETSILRSAQLRLAQSVPDVKPPPTTTPIAKPPRVRAPRIRKPRVPKPPAEPPPLASLPLREIILLIANRLPQPFHKADLAYECHRECPERFSLHGHPEHADSNKVWSKLADLKANGFVQIEEESMYRVLEKSVRRKRLKADRTRQKTAE